MRDLVVAVWIAVGLLWCGVARADDAKPAEQKPAPEKETQAGEKKDGEKEKAKEEGKEEEEKTPTAPDEEDMDEVVVTATRTAQTISNVPASVTVITSKDIARRNIRNIDEALKNAVGAFERRGKGMMDVRAGVTLRGFADQKRTLILLNGRPINTAYTGEVHWSAIPVDDVDRIEVVRGPNSALYGGNAMGGVINIITKKPMKRQVMLRGGYGTDDTYIEHFGYGDRFFDRFSVSFSYDRKATDGYRTSLATASIQRPGAATAVYPTQGYARTTTSQGDLRYIIGDTGSNWWDEQSLAGKASFDIDDHSTVSFEIVHSSYDYGYDWGHSYLRDKRDGTVVDTGYVRTDDGTRLRLYPAYFIGGPGGMETNIFNVTYENVLTDWLTIKAAWGLVDQPSNWYITPYTYQATKYGGRGDLSETPSRTGDIDLQADIAIGKRQVLTVGGGVKKEKARNQEWELANWRLRGDKRYLQTISEGRSETWSMYAQDEIEILENLKAYVGCRYDHWRVFDGYNHVRGFWDTFYPFKREIAWSPKAGLIYKPFTSTALRGAVGTAFRPPNVYELYRTYRSSWGTVYESNPRLKPETTKSWELGIEQKLPTKTKISATIFQNYIDDLIYTASTDVANVQSRQNAAKARGDGIELGLEQEITSWLNGFVNFSHTTTTILRNPFNTLSEHHQVTYTPKELFNFGANVEYGPFGATLRGRHVGKVYTNDMSRDSYNGVYGSYDPFFTLDGKVTWEVTKNAKLSFSVDNIFNERYFQSYLAPGRTVFADVTISF